MKNYAKFFLIAILSLGVTSSLADAASIGINYQGVSGGAGALAAIDVAGFLSPQANWNNAVAVGQGPPNTPILDLVDDSGAATTLDITSWTQTSGNSWTVGIGGGTPDEKLNADFSDQGAVVNLAQIPYAQYSVAVHYNNNEGPSTNTLTVGGISRTITTGNVGITPYYVSGYLEGTDANGTTPTNVTVFTGLTSSTLEIAMTGGTNNGITAIQILEVPEPSSLALLGAGIVGLAGIARKRRRKS